PRIRPEKAKVSSSPAVKNPLGPLSRQPGLQEGEAGSLQDSRAERSTPLQKAGGFVQEGVDRTKRGERKEESTTDQLIGSTWKAKAAQDQISSTESKLSGGTARPASAGAGRARAARLPGRDSPRRRNTIGLSAAPPPNQHEDRSSRHRPLRARATLPGPTQQVRPEGGVGHVVTAQDPEGRGREGSPSPSRRPCPLTGKLHHLSQDQRPPG
ncbi:hypothetical protein P7K49_010844, partial [Saguinus oedipus]